MLSSVFHRLGRSEILTAQQRCLVRIVIGEETKHVNMFGSSNRAPFLIQNNFSIIVKYSYNYFPEIG